MVEVGVRADHEDLMKVDDNSVMIVGNPYGILGQLFRLHPIQSLNTIFILTK